MGSETVKLLKQKTDRLHNTRQILRDLKALQYMLDHEMFETDIQRIGAEQELCFVDGSWRPAPVLMEVLQTVNDPHFTTEYARFNMEINLDPLEFRAGCLRQLEKDLKGFLAKGEKAARKFGAHILLTGILPTIRFGDIKMENLTPLERYKALTEEMHNMRGGLFEFFIEGPDSLVLRDGLALFEGSNTSFQVHLQVAPHEFAQLYNWSMAVTGPLMAASTNSPLLLGKRLWRETRIALFQQSIDTRSTSEMMRERVPRVCFGTGWVKNSILEIYKDDFARHPALLGTTREEDSLQTLLEGGIPKLNALNVHNGTIYKWNRPCYGVTDGKPHLRIEQRVLPAGPSVPDEIANAAFWLGMMKGMPEEYARISEKMDFDFAKENFFKAARHGLGSYFWWTIDKKPKRIAAKDLLEKELIPIAEEGLKKAKIDQKDIDKYLGIIKDRVDTGRTGSQWMLTSYQKLKTMGSKDEALVATTGAMYQRQQSDQPVHNWNLAELPEAGHWLNRYRTIEQIMTTDIFTVKEDDALDFAANVMEWRNIRHLPVENQGGELVGMINCKMLTRFYSQSANHPIEATVQDVMARDLPMATPEMPTRMALAILKESKIGCLPVMRAGKLVGLVTEFDFLHVAQNLFREMEEELGQKT